MTLGTIIHKHSYKCGGIGDFIRASISFYSICKRFGYNYYISFDENKYMGDCFDTPNIPDDIKTQNKSYLELIAGTCDFEAIRPVINILEKNAVCIVKSNLIGFESCENLNKIRQEYFSQILKPTNKVIEKINEIYNKFNISENNYISIHIRCGDKNMSSNHLIDLRIDINNDNTYTKYNEIIKDFVLKYGENLPILIHSDCKVFKNKIKELNANIIDIDLSIKHIAEDIGDNTSNNYIATIAEFYILSKARKIYMPDVYSGFSHIASYVEGKPLYTKIHEHRLNILNVNSNIIII